MPWSCQHDHDPHVGFRRAARALVGPFRSLRQAGPQLCHAGETSAAAVGAASFASSVIARSMGASHGSAPRDAVAPRAASAAECSNQLHHSSSSERVRAT